MIRPILQDGADSLREVAAPLPEELFDTPQLRDMLKDMADTLDKEPDGVALAAPQIGLPYRIFIVRFDRTLPSPVDETESDGTKKIVPREKMPKPEPNVGVFINPTFVNSSRKRLDMEEGCLSVRSIYGHTYRHERATVRAQDANGKVFERGGGGLIAQIYQHETDHLNGILFVDHAIDLVKIIKRKNGEEETKEVLELPENYGQ